MSEQREPYASGGPDELPPAIAEFFTAITRDRHKIAISISKADIWVLLSLIQFISRVPHIPAKMGEFARHFGRQLQGVFPDEVQPYLERGWDAAYDVPATIANISDGIVREYRKLKPEDQAKVLDRILKGG